MSKAALPHWVWFAFGSWVVFTVAGNDLLENERDSETRAQRI